MQSERDARIRERAYHIWVEEGRIDGRQEEHWHRAEREIAEEETRPGPESAAHGTAEAADPARQAATRGRRPRAETTVSTPTGRPPPTTAGTGAPAPRGRSRTTMPR